MTGFQIKHIDHIVLRVEDMERSLDFYTGVLSCQIKKRNEKYGMIHLGAGAR